MAAMNMREQDHVDVFRTITGRAQVRDQLAGRRAEQLAGARVDLHPVGAGVDQKAVDRQFHGKCHVRRGIRVADLIRLAHDFRHVARRGAV
jgi:hypothetical protein